MRKEFVRFCTLFFFLFRLSLFAVKQLAQQCGVCMNTPKRVFSDCTDKGIGEYYLDMRKAKAHRKPAGRSKSRERILGSRLFLSFLFSQCLKRESGISASEYRAR